MRNNFKIDMCRALFFMWVLIMPFSDAFAGGDDDRVEERSAKAVPSVESAPPAFDYDIPTYTRFSREIKPSHDPFVYETHEPVERLLAALVDAKRGNLEIIQTEESDMMTRVLHHLVGSETIPGGQLRHVALRRKEHLGQARIRLSYFRHCQFLESLTLEGFDYDEAEKVEQICRFERKLNDVDHRSDELLNGAESALTQVQALLPVITTLHGLSGLEGPYTQLEQEVASLKLHLNDVYAPLVSLPDDVGLPDLGDAHHRGYNLYRVAVAGYSDLVYAKLILDQQIVFLTQMLALQAQTQSTGSIDFPPDESIAQMYRESKPQECLAQKERLTARLSGPLTADFAQARGRVMRELVAMVYTKTMLTSDAVHEGSLLDRVNRSLQQMKLEEVQDIGSYLEPRHNSYGMPEVPNVPYNTFVRARFDQVWPKYKGFLMTLAAMVVIDQNVVPMNQDAGLIQNPGFDNFSERLTLRQAVHAFVHKIFNPTDWSDANDPHLLISVFYDYILAQQALEKGIRSWQLVTGEVYQPQ